MRDKTQLPAVRVPRELLNNIDNSFRQYGLDEWKAASKNGRVSLSGKTNGGITVSFSSYSSDGYSERTVSSSDRLTPARRRKEATRMYREGLTQTQIAERLGCSQKTVSNDLQV